MQHKELTMKFKKTLAATAAVLLLAGQALAQSHGMGHDMVRGHGGGGCGGGQGMGPGMMGGYGGSHGMGMGMGGMGGMGSMGGMGGMGMGGMRGDTNSAWTNLKLSADQRKQIADIRATSSKAMWQLMGTMHEQDGHMQGMHSPSGVDEAAARKSFQTMTQTRQAMFDLQLDTRKKIDGVLTKEQREQLAQ
jgi:Spy/CpxP family protein refolding chaperone